MLRAELNAVLKNLLKTSGDSFNVQGKGRKFCSNSILISTFECCGFHQENDNKNHPRIDIWNMERDEQLNMLTNCVGQIIQSC